MKSQMALKLQEQLRGAGLGQLARGGGLVEAMSRAECRHVSEVIKKDTAEDKVHYLEVDKMLKTLLGKKARITAAVVA